jgi:hypothetical protein
VVINRNRFRPTKTFAEAEEVRTQDAVADAVSALDLRVGDQVLVEQENLLNSYLLTGEGSAPTIFAKPHNQVIGLNYTLTCNKPLVINQSVSFFGCTFSASSPLTQPQLRLTSANGPQIVFNNCTFVRRARQATLPFVEVEAGAQAVFVGCRFLGLSGGTETDNSEEGMVSVVPGFSEPAYSIYSSGTETVLTFAASGHSFSAGETAHIVGSTIAGLDGTHAVSSVGVGRIVLSLDTSSTDIAISNFVDSGSTARFTTSAAHGLSVGDTVHLTRGGGAEGVVSPTDVTGDQVVSAVGSTTEFDVAIDPGTPSSTSGQAFKGGIAQASIQRLPYGASTVHFVGCVRHPVGAAYAVADSDSYVTKTGCI